jgi:hypothetical protein
MVDRYPDSTGISAKPTGFPGPFRATNLHGKPHCRGDFMHTRTLSRILILLLVIGLPFSSAKGSTDGWTAVATGIDYKVFPGPAAGYNIHVARMDRSNKSLFIESGLTSGAINRPWGTIRDMANYYNGAINYWGKAWGGTNQVVVAINGDFFDKVSGYLPEKGMIHSGWYDRPYPGLDNLTGGATAWSGFVWALDRDAFIGECVDNTILQITYGDGWGSLPIKNINAPAASGELAIFTPDYGYTTKDIGAGAQVVVQMRIPTVILNRDLAVSGTVVAVYDNGGPIPIPWDSIVLEGTGTTAKDLLAHSRIGETIGVTQEVTSKDAATCKTTVGAKDWTNAYASIGGSYAVLRDGKVDGYDGNDGAHETRARTAIAFNTNYIFFIVVEGLYRPDSKGGSIGLTYEAVGNFAKTSLGAAWAMMEDGGGSSTMVINGQIVNHMADCAKDYVPIPNNSECERTLVNGLMMVVQRPKQQSTTFAEADPVTPRRTTALRLGPGTNYGTLASIPGQTQLFVRPEPHGLNGVVAKDAAWWKVAYGTQEGWISELALTGRQMNLPVIVK